MLISSTGKRYEEVLFRPYEPVVYETVRTYCRRPFKLKEHVDRLRVSAKLVGIDADISVREIEDLLEEASKEIEGEVYYKIYLRVSGEILVESTRLPEDEALAEVKFSKVRKAPPSVIPPQLKVVGRTDVLLGRLDKEGYYEALMLTHDGYLAEGTFSNVFLVMDGKIHTPSLDCSILSGITREVVIEIAKEEGIEVFERRILPHEVFCAQEVFLTHTSRGIVPVRKVENATFKVPGEITKRLKEAFRRYVQGLCCDSRAT